MNKSTKMSVHIRIKRPLIFNEDEGDIKHQYREVFIPKIKLFMAMDDASSPLTFASRAQVEAGWTVDYTHGRQWISLILPLSRSVAL